MKERPILYSTPMVKSLLLDLKTMTRRIINPQPVIDTDSGYVYFNKHKYAFDIHNWKEECLIACPYGQIGNVLWVRETHYRKGIWIKNGFTKKGNQKWKFVASDNVILYENSQPTLFEKSRNKKYPGKEMWYKRLARFMPRSAARIFLEIKNIKVEKLNDISREDAIAEGIGRWTEERLRSKPTHYQVYYQENPRDPDFYSSNPIDSYESLWQSLHGKDAWKENPWVWAVDFKKINK